MQNNKNAARLQPKVVKIFIAILAVTILYTVFGFVGLPYIIKSILPEKLSNALNRQVSISKVEVNPYYLTLHLKGITVTDRSDKTFMSLDDFFVDLQIASLFKKALIVKNVSIAKPFLRLARRPDGTFNFSDLAGVRAPETSPDAEPQVPLIPNFVIENLLVESGRMALIDGLPAVPFETALESLNITLKNVSNQAGSKAVYKISVKTPEKELIDCKGTLSLFPLRSEGTLSLQNVLLKKYAPYYRDLIDFEIADGTIGIQTGFHYASDDPSIGIGLSRASVSVASLKAHTKEDREKLFAIPSLAITDTDVDVLKQEITIGSLSSTKGYLLCKRFADGSLNLDRLIAVKALKAHSAPSQQKAAPAPAPWHVTLKSFVIEDHTIQGQDSMFADPVNILLGHVKIEGKDLTTKPNGKGQISISLRWNKKGNVSVKGSVAVDPVSANLAVNVSGLDIRSLQPYFTDKIKLVVTDGYFNTNGRVQFSQKAGSDPAVSYQGDASITGFASGDRKQALDFLKWKSLYLANVNAGYKPLKISIDEVSLTDFYSRLIIHSDGTINIRNIFSPEGEAAQEPPGAAAKETPEATATLPPEITIKNVVLQGGTVSFSDRLTQPNFDTELTELGGKLSGLSSKEQSRADIFLAGKHSGTSPLEIKGKVNPLIANRYADLTVAFKDIEMSPFSPYSGKYLGYILQKGKLTLELAYKLLDNKLQGKNRIYLDQLTLGDKVDSPDATSLPVKLGIALLKDSNGRIALDFPVNGDLRNPEFSLGKIIITMLGNLFAKIVSAPFAAISSIFGGGAELSYMDFDHGSSQINASMHEKLKKLITALENRPALQLEIQGAVDPEDDSTALRRIQFDNLLKAQKLKEMAKKNLDAVPLAQIKIEPDDFITYLEKAYAASDIPKPRDEAGKIKKLPVAEMEKLLFTGIDISDKDLRRLAHKRAAGVENYIIKSEKIDPHRIFILRPNSLADRENKEKHQSRVNFFLK